MKEVIQLFHFTDEKLSLGEEKLWVHGCLATMGKTGTQTHSWGQRQCLSECCPFPAFFSLG